MIRKRSEQTVYAARRGSELLGWLVVDSRISGRACGGIRLMPDVTERELRLLARSMTLKYGFLGLPRGGAKAGVIGDPEDDQETRRQALHGFLMKMAPLIRKRQYLPQADMGTSPELLRSVLADVGTPAKRRELRGASSGVFAAATVRCSVERACTHLGWSLPGRSVAIEGFGSVGQALAGMLSQSGAVIVAVSTAQGAVFNQDGLDIPTLTALTRAHGSRAVELFEGGARIECQQLLELPVDILCPCARHDSITDHNQDRIRARLVCAGANNPTTPAARMQLEARGILVMPDFVTSCGGVLGGALEYASVPRPAILRFIDRHVGPRVSWLLDRSSVLGESAFQIATQVSLERFAAVKARAEKPSLRGLLFNQLLALYRRGVIPGPVTSVLARRYAAANLAERRFG